MGRAIGKPIRDVLIAYGFAIRRSFLAGRAIGKPIRDVLIAYGFAIRRSFYPFVGEEATKLNLKS